MKNISRFKYLALSLLVPILLMSCEPIVFKNKTPAFTVTYPANWSKTEKPPHKWTVLRTTDPSGLPALTIDVFSVELDLAETPERHIDFLKNIYPESSDHKIIKEEMIALKDGTRAISYLIKWQWRSGTVLISSCVKAYKERKLISVNVTDKYGISTDIIERVTHSLEFEKRKIVQPRISADMLCVAVMDFKANGVSQLIASNISEIIRNELIIIGSFTVLERSQVDQIMKEQGFQMTGLTGGCNDASCAVKVGKLLSAKKILIGKVMKIGKKIIISGRIVDVEKGIGEQAANQSAYTIDELDEAANKFTRKLTGN